MCVCLCREDDESQRSPTDIKKRGKRKERGNQNHTGLCSQCEDGSIAEWGGFVSGRERAFVSCGRICGTICKFAISMFLSFIGMKK